MTEWMKRRGTGAVRSLRRPRQNVVRPSSLVQCATCVVMLILAAYAVTLPNIQLDAFPSPAFPQGSVLTNDIAKEAGYGGNNWCSRVERARRTLSVESLRISTPCEGDGRGKASAVVCVLTGGAESKEKASRTVFAASDYVDGAVALGASVSANIDADRTDMLLLVREGFVLSDADAERVRSVGWKVGTVPDWPLEERYVPRFPRYKATYSKLAVAGLEEYECAMLIDADALVVGDIREFMTCGAFTGRDQRIAAVLDLAGVRPAWKIFNSGVLLWNTSVAEVERLYELSTDEKFMKRFSSDQEFLNHAYPERLNATLNERLADADILELTPEEEKLAYREGRVVHLPWGYNAQTHVEVRRSDYWKRHRPDTKIIHFTERKGWQCPERYEPFAKQDLERAWKCDWKDKDPVCNCIEGYLWWQSLARGKEMLASEKSKR